MKEDPNEWNNLAGKQEYALKEKELGAFIPFTWAPLSEYSRYNFNEYFIGKGASKD
jgi:hypothetical protein